MQANTQSLWPDLTWEFNFSLAGVSWGHSQGQGKDVSHVRSVCFAGRRSCLRATPKLPRQLMVTAARPRHSSVLQEEHPRGPMHPALPPLPQQLPGREHPFIPWAPALPHTAQHPCPCPQTGISREQEQGPAGTVFLISYQTFLFLKYENNISLCLCRERSGWVCSPASGRASSVLRRVWKGWLPPALL